MFSKSESKQLRQDFWIAFGKSYPRKWILYHTKIKGLAFKFHFDLKMAMVSLDVDSPDLERRISLWEKLISLRTIFLENHHREAIFEDCYILENHKEISRIYVCLDKVSIHNKNTWQEVMIFLSVTMDAFEAFFNDFREILED
ncbi:DUF4268 domain-containing protein [Spongiimicrobium salis]|uniref:DUF4268 domain-containing protein n=1 Tax=Spongiimicrobium salis TaxID=1667022 RepID=UPI00374C9540